MNPLRQIRGSVYALSAAHFACDAYSSMLGVFLPLLTAKFHLSFSQAGLLAGVLLFSASMTQPVYGMLADRLRGRFFIILGPLISAIFLSSLGVAPSYLGLLVFLFLGGAGVSAFHPQAASMTSAATTEKRGLHMSVFVTGGSIGYALGPVYIMAVISAFGLERSYLAAIPALIISAVLVRHAPHPQPPVRQDRNLGGELLKYIRPLLILYFLVVIRSAVQIVFTSLLPTYFQFRGFSVAYGSQILTIYLFFGAIGGFLGGPLADRFGGKRVNTFSMLFSAPLLLAFLTTEGWLSNLFLIGGGMVLLFTNPVNLVMAQELVPRGASTIAALMMGFAWGTGGAAVPLVGWLADHYGLQRAMGVTVLIPLLGVLLTSQLPDQGRRPTVSGAPVEMVLK